MPAQDNVQNNMTNHSAQNATNNATHNAKQSVKQATGQAMQKTTLFFCVVTSGLLALFGWLMTAINHSPWGLVGAAVVVLTLTAQQAIRKPQSVVASSPGISPSRGVANMSRGAV